MNDTGNIELKPCPFCGKTNAKRHCDHASGWIGCECGASGPRIKLDVDRYPGDSFRPNEEQKVISAWNHRAAEAVTDGEALFLLECADTLAKDFRHHMADKLRELVKQKALTPPSAKGE